MQCSHNEKGEPTMVNNHSELSVKLIIIDANRRVVADNSASELRLPAQSATLAAREKYRLELFVILTSTLHVEDACDQSRDTEPIVLVCRLQHSDVLSESLTWIELQKASLRFAATEDRALQAGLSELDSFDSGLKPSSFGRYSALDELREWYIPHLTALGVRETGIQQWNGDPWFALFRVKVESLSPDNVEPLKAVWFKAVGSPNTREFTVTKALTDECPYWFPKILATKPEWHGWLMEEVNGYELDDESDGRPWALTARVLAKVQKCFVGQDDRLLDLGCRDWRMPRVLASLDPFFEDMEEIMQRQPADPPHILDREELRNLKFECRDLCRKVEDLDIPYTIAHGDFSPHNVIVLNGWPVLIDWAEAYLTFPFISWEYFWNRMIKDHPSHSAWHERMHRNYAYRVWATMLGKARVDEGMRLSPAMAVLIHALYSIDDPDERRNPQNDKIKRSLVRRLQRELQVLEPAGAL
jgi:hypothetical protein